MVSLAYKYWAQTSDLVTYTRILHNYAVRRAVVYRLENELKCRLDEKLCLRVDCPTDSVVVALVDQVNLQK